jgi:hypothetical protein
MILAMQDIGRQLHALGIQDVSCHHSFLDASYAAHRGHRRGFFRTVLSMVERFVRKIDLFSRPAPEKQKSQVIAPVSAPYSCSALFIAKLQLRFKKRAVTSPLSSRKKRSPGLLKLTLYVSFTSYRFRTSTSSH